MLNLIAAIIVLTLAALFGLAINAFAAWIALDVVGGIDLEFRELVGVALLCALVTANGVSRT